LLGAAHWNEELLGKSHLTVQVDLATFPSKYKKPVSYSAADLWSRLWKAAAAQVRVWKIAVTPGARWADDVAASNAKDKFKEL
jgi:hypothetical protein